MKKICLLFGIFLLIFNLGLFNLVLAESNLLYNGEPTNEKYISPDGVDLAPYMRELQRQIKMNWNPPKFDFSARVILVFTIEKDGRLSKSSVYKSSGFTAADEAALNALHQTAPFRPLPSEYKGNSVDIQFTFDYNVWGGNPMLSLVSNEVDFYPYMNELTRRIKMNWEPPRGKERLRVVVLMKVSKDGRLLSSYIKNSSNDPEADKAALNAIQRSSPFKPLPSDFKGESVDIHFTFGYHLTVPTTGYTYTTTTDKINKSVIVKSNEGMYTELLPKKLYATTKGSIRSNNGYKFLNVLQTNKYTQNAYLLKCKVDFKNKQIGVKKSFAGSAPEIFTQPRSFFLYRLLFDENIKMQSVNDNLNHTKIYEHACMP